MGLWKDNTLAKPAPEPTYPSSFDAKGRPPAETAPKSDASAARATPAITAATTSTPSKESLIADDLTIEGKIEGSGSVRIAGKFKGDVNVQGDLTIEARAKLTGNVRADKVTIAGELEGNVLEASSINLQPTAIVMGDLKARSLTVGAGAAMRGKVEFGGQDSEAPKLAKHGSIGAAMEIGARQ